MVDLSERFDNWIWRVNRHLSLRRRRLLALRLLRGDAEQITFRRNDLVWSAWAWDERITPQLFIEGAFQGDVIEALVTWLRAHGASLDSEKVAVDVGAHIGTTTMPLAQLTQQRLIAIEPVPQNFALLQTNLRQNGLADRVVCIQSAIALRAGMVQIVIPATNSGGAEISRDGRAPTFADRDFIRETVAAHSDKLIDLLASAQISPHQVSWVWSDTQGCEAAVIESGRELWLGGAPLYVELWPRALEQQATLEEFLRLACEYFDRFIARDDLVRYRADARTRTVNELAELAAAHTGESDTDVLLLPRGYAFNPVPHL